MMNELINLLETNNIKYEKSTYGYNDECIIIKGNKYQLEIYCDNQGLVRDLHNIPYTWGMMGSTTLEDILKEVEDYLMIKINYSQTTIFDFMEKKVGD